MKTLGRLALSVLVALALPACKTAEKYAKNNASTAQWLNANAGVASIDVSGYWKSDDWGLSYFSQKGNRVTGHLGKYPVGGVVRGHTLYLAVTEDNWTYYTVVAAQVQRGVLEGFYSDSVPFSAGDQSPITLLRTSP
jgi:hypothetical protein